MTKENLEKLLEELITVDKQAIKEIKNLRKRVKGDKSSPSYIV